MAQLVGGTYIGGAGGIPFNGPPGLRASTRSARTSSRSKVLRACSWLRALREDMTSTLTFYGQPGDEVYLRMSRQTAFRDMPSWKGVLLTNNPHPEYIAIIGTIPASGVLSTTLDVPDMGVGVSAQSLFLQAQFKNTDGAIWLGELRGGDGARLGLLIPRCFRAHVSPRGFQAPGHSVRGIAGLVESALGALGDGGTRPRPPVRDARVRDRRPGSAGLRSARERGDRDARAALSGRRATHRRGLGIPVRPCARSRARRR